MEREPVRAWTALLTRSKHTQGADPRGRGPSPPWQSAPRQSCALSPDPSPWTNAGAAAWLGTGCSVLLQRSRAYPPATPSLEGTGGRRVLAPTSWPLPAPSQLPPGRTFSPISLPSRAAVLKGQGEWHSLAFPLATHCPPLPLHAPHRPPNTQLSLVPPLLQPPPCVAPQCFQGSAQTPQPSLAG